MNKKIIKLNEIRKALRTLLDSKDVQVLSVTVDDTERCILTATIKIDYRQGGIRKASFDDVNKYPDEIILGYYEDIRKIMGYAPITV